MGHRLDADGGDVGEDAAPSGVEGSTDFLFWVDHQDWNAVGAEDAEYHAGFCGDYPVASGAICGGIAGDDVDFVAVHLVYPGDGFQGGDFAAEKLPVGIDSGAIVAYEIGEIERGELVVAGAAGASDESIMDRGVGPCAEDFD
jgi:hypothetical protein